MTISAVQLYLILKEKLGEKDAQNLVEYIAIKVDNARIDRMEEMNLRAKKAASRLKKWERIAMITMIVIYLLVIGLYFKK